MSCNIVKYIKDSVLIIFNNIYIYNTRKNIYIYNTKKYIYIYKYKTQKKNKKN